MRLSSHPKPTLIPVRSNRKVHGAHAHEMARISAGSTQVVEDDDGWTLRTRDGSLSAHYEQTRSREPSSRRNYPDFPFPRWVRNSAGVSTRKS